MRIVELGRYPTQIDAELVRNCLQDAGIHAEIDGAEAANVLGHLGPQIAGVRILVDEAELKLAKKILQEIKSRPDQGDFGEEFLDDDADDHEDDDQLTIPEELTRAWRAALIGVMLLPPLLNLYSMYVLVKHGFFLNESRNWRIWATLALNTTTIIVVVYFLSR